MENGKSQKRTLSQTRHGDPQKHRDGVRARRLQRAEIMTTTPHRPESLQPDTDAQRPSEAGASRVEEERTTDVLTTLLRYQAVRRAGGLDVEAAVQRSRRAFR